MQLPSASAMAAQHIDFNTDLRFDWHSMIIQSDRDKVVDFIHKAVRPTFSDVAQDVFLNKVTEYENKCYQRCITRTLYLRRISLPQFRLTERARRPIEPLQTTYDRAQGETAGGAAGEEGEEGESEDYAESDVVLTSNLSGAWITNAERKRSVCNACVELSNTIEDSTCPYYDGEITHLDVLVECTRIEGAVAEKCSNTTQYLAQLRKEIQDAASVHELNSIFRIPNETTLTF